MSFSLRFKEGVWVLNRPYLMGVMNLNADSFFSESRINDKDVFARRLEEMISSIDILDLGAESTRPGADPVSAETELTRLLPTLSYVKKTYPRLRVSIDTYKPEVARECIAQGADMINDITAGEFSGGEMFSLCADNEIPLVLMHKRGTPKTMQKRVSYRDVVEEVYDYLEKRVALAQKHGLLQDQLLIDVGIGFGKKLQHNLDLLRSLPKFKEIGVGMLVGASRKSMLGELTGQPVEKRLAASIAIHLAALVRFCHVVRCHDVQEMKDALKVYFTLIDYRGEGTSCLLKK